MEQVLAKMTNFSLSLEIGFHLLHPWTVLGLRKFGTTRKLQLCGALLGFKCHERKYWYNIWHPTLKGGLYAILWTYFISIKFKISLEHTRIVSSLNSFRIQNLMLFNSFLPWVIVTFYVNKLLNFACPIHNLQFKFQSLC